MAKINITNKVNELDELQALEFAKQLLTHRKPKDGSFDYGLISYGTALDVTFIGNKRLEFAIHVMQQGKRKNDKSPINIVIEYHQSIF